MQKANCLPAKWRNVVFFLTALLIVVADQFSKGWIRSYTEEQAIFDAGFFRIIHSQNTGAAFGLFQGQNLPLTIIGLVGVAILLLYAVLLYRRFSPLGRLAWVGLGLVLGGTVGNLIDRLRLGYVTDFIDFGFWPAFNLADSAIVVGVIIFAYSLLSLARAEKH